MKIFYDGLSFQHLATVLKSRYCGVCRSVVWQTGTDNDPYRGHTAPLTSKRCILYIYSTNIGTEYFKHSIYSLFFPSSKCSLFHNSNVFVPGIIHILYTRCAKIKKIPPPKVLNILNMLYTLRFFLFKMQFVS